jgi:hypothetical protein
MKTYNQFFDHELSRYGKKLNNEKLLKSNIWINVNVDNYYSSNLYFFRKNEELSISREGIVEKGRWYYMGKDKLVIEENEKSFLFRLGYFDKRILVLRSDDLNYIAFFVNNKSRFDNINSIENILAIIEKKKVIRKEVMRFFLPILGSSLCGLGWYLNYIFDNPFLVNLLSASLIFIPFPAVMYIALIEKEYRYGSLFDALFFWWSIFCILGIIYITCGGIYTLFVKFF